MVVISNNHIKEFHKNSIIPKVLKKGSKVKIKHYSTFEPTINSIKNIHGNFLVMELPQKFLENNILVGDSIVTIYLHDDVEYVLNGEVIDITLIHPQYITIKIENVEKFKNVRKQARYSVSLSANVKNADTKQVYFAIVKNISLSGVSFTCNNEFEAGTDLFINIAVSKDVIISFYGRIVRARQLLSCFEYGMVQTDIDLLNQEELENYIQKLQEEEENMFANIV